MDVPVLADLQELLYIGSMGTNDVVWKTCRERWAIGRIERESGKSVPTVRLDNDNDDIYIYI